MKTEVRLITPKLAEEMLKRNQSNRNISDRHVNFLAEEMLNENWKFDGQPIRFTTNGNLLDGQHRLMAVVKSGKPQKFLVITGIEQAAFKVMDTEKTRSASDIFGIEGISSAATVSAAIRMILFLKQGYGSADQQRIKPSNSTLLAFYQKEKKYLDELASESLKLCREFNRILAPSQIAGLKYLMAAKNMNDADIFWNKLCTGLDLQPGNPVKPLRSILTTDRLSKTKLPLRNRYALIIKAWNNFRTKKETKVLKFDPLETFPEIV